MVSSNIGLLAHELHDYLETLSLRSTNITFQREKEGVYGEKAGRPI